MYYASIADETTTFHLATQQVRQDVLEQGEKMYEKLYEFIYGVKGNSMVK